MKPLSINLAGRPFYNRRLYLAAYGVSIAVLVVMTVLNVVMFTADQVALGRINDAEEHMGTEMGSLDRREEQIRRELQGFSLAALAHEVTFTREALLQRYFSWTRLFNRLETLLPYDVRLQSIRPAIREDFIQILVAGVAKTPEAFSQFEERLIESPLFAEVYPSSEIWEGDRRGLSFSLSFAYLPDRAPPEGGDAEAVEPSATVEQAGRADAASGEEAG